MAYINVDEVYILDNTGLQVDMATDIPFVDAGFSDAQKEQARKNIGAGGSNRNLLDNWYFVGGGSQLGGGVFPINQKGQTSYTGTVASSIDRWSLQNGNTSISLSASGMTIYTNGSGYGYGGQTLETEFALDGSYTFSVLLADGTLYSTPTNINLTLPSGLLFYFANNKSVNWRNPANTTCETIAAVKLEKGTVSTLINDAPPNYVEELHKCEGYYKQIDTYVGMGVAISNSQVRLNIPYPTMNKAPTSGILNTPQVFINGSWVPATSYSVTDYNDSYIMFGINVSGVTAGSSYMVKAQYLQISADL